MKDNFVVTIAGGCGTHTPGIVMMLLENMAQSSAGDPSGTITITSVRDHRRRLRHSGGGTLLQVKFSYTTDPQAAFTDVDFVMAHIRVGL